MNEKNTVREGYDKVSFAYRADDFDSKDDPCYGQGMDRLGAHLVRGSRVLDLGCGCGIPVARELSRQHQVTGVDISPVQIKRARSLVPEAEFILADMTALGFPAGEFDAIVSLYAVIHVPIAEQPALFKKIWSWLKPDGWFLCSVGHGAWTGTEQNWLGVADATMFWSHEDQGTYETWLKETGFRLAEARFIPEGSGGHMMMLAQRIANNKGLT